MDTPSRPVLTRAAGQVESITNIDSDASIRRPGIKYLRRGSRLELGVGLGLGG
jgi:hypothetical protein